MLLPAAKRTEDPDAPCVAGDWCCFCPAMAVCPLKQHLALSKIDEPDPGCFTLPVVKALKPVDVGFLSGFFNSPDFAAWLKALAARSSTCLNRGVKSRRKLWAAASATASDDEAEVERPSAAISGKTSGLRSSRAPPRSRNVTAGRSRRGPRGDPFPAPDA